MEEEGRVDVEKIDKTVAFLWKRHAEGKLLPDFVGVLRENYRDKAGWEFVKGPGNDGWDYFLDKVGPLDEAVAEGSLLALWGEKPFSGKYVKKADTQKWQEIARERHEEGIEVQQQNDSSRMLKLSNIGQAMKPKLFKLLVKFGLVEYCEFETAAGGNFTCYTQFKDSGDSGKLVAVTNKKTTKGAKKQQSQFQVSFAEEGMLRPPSPILRLTAGTGSAKKVSDIDLKEIGVTFSLFTTKPPSVEYELHQFGRDYTQLFITYRNTADAESALQALQKSLTDDFNFELVYLSEEEKCECINNWRKSGSNVGSLHWGGDRLRARDMGCDMPLLPEGWFVELLRGYKVMGDDTLETIKDLPEYQQRFHGIQQGIRDTRYHQHIIEKSFGGDWSEDPGLEFSAFRLRSRLEVLDEAGKVEGTVASTDYEQGTYLHLNLEPTRQPAVAAAPQDSAMDLAIDNEEAYEAEQPPKPETPILTRDEFERIKQDQIRTRQAQVVTQQLPTWNVGPGPSPGSGPGPSSSPQPADPVLPRSPKRPPPRDRPKSGGFKLFTPSEDQSKKEEQQRGDKGGGKGRKRGFREFGGEKDGPKRGFNDRRERDYERRDRGDKHQERRNDKDKDGEKRDRRDRKDKRDRKERKGRRSGREEERE